MLTVAVAGGGAWGTALGKLAAAGGAPVRLWAREPEVVADINEHHENRRFLPGIALPASLKATSSLKELAAANAILLVTPAQHLRAVAAGLALHIAPGTALVICAKGIEQTTFALMSEVLVQVVPHALPAVLSGPSFAGEVAQGLPTAVTLAIADRALGMKLVNRLGQATFRPYVSDDVVGAQIGGAVKNVLAIACGIVDGVGLGHSARAALITRGLAEMTRLGLALGAHIETLMGLSGLGDLVLTCTSGQSRNYSFGLALGQGGSPQALLSGRESVVEGAFTASALVSLSKRHGVEMPISIAVEQVLAQQLTIAEAVDGLLRRPFTEEHKITPSS